MLMIPTLALAGPRLEVAPAEGFVEEVYTFRALLDRGALAADETLAVEVLSGAGDLVATVPLARSADGGSASGTVALATSGRFQHRAVARGRRGARLLAGVEAAPADGPTVRVPSLRVEVVPPEPVDLPEGHTEVPVRLTATAQGGDANFRFRWRRAGEADWHEGVAFVPRLSAGRHTIEVFAADGGREGGRATTVVEVRTAERGRGPSIRARVELPECRPRALRGCDGVLSAEVEGGTPPYRVAWDPDVLGGSAAALEGESVRFAFPGGRSVVRARVTDAAGATATTDLDVLLRTGRVAVVAPPSLVEGLDRAVSAARDDVVSVAGAMLARQASETGTDPAALCTGALRPSALLGRALPWDLVLCAEADEDAPTRAGDRRAVELRLVGLAGEQETAETVDCARLDAACAEAVDAAAARLVRAAPLDVRLGDPDPPAPVPTGSLRVETDPPGAEVRVNGAPVGRSPLTLPLRAGVPFEVELAAPTCHASLRRTVTVPVGVELPLVETLCAPGALLDVTSTPSGADVLIDGRPTRQQTPTRGLETTVGEHEVTVLHSGFLTWQKSVTLAAGTTYVDAELEPLGTTLRVVNRGATRHLYLDDAPQALLGAGAERVFASLSPGPHRVCVHHRRTVDLSTARCSTVVLPGAPPLVVNETEPPFEADTPPTPPVAEASPPALRIGASAEVFRALSVENTRLWPESATVVGGAFVVEHVPTPVVRSAYVLRLSYLDGDGRAYVRSYSVRTAVRQIAVDAEALAHLPLVGERLAVGPVLRVMRSEETLNPHAEYRTRRETWGLHLGGATRARLLGGADDRFALTLEYQLQFVLAPRDLAETVGRVHALGAGLVFYL